MHYTNYYQYTDYYTLYYSKRYYSKFYHTEYSTQYYSPSLQYSHRSKVCKAGETRQNLAKTRPKRSIFAGMASIQVPII